MQRAAPREAGAAARVATQRKVGWSPRNPEKPVGADCAKRPCKVSVRRYDSNAVSSLLGRIITIPQRSSRGHKPRAWSATVTTARPSKLQTPQPNGDRKWRYA